MKKLLVLIFLILGSILLLPTGIIYIGGYDDPHLLPGIYEEAEHEIENSEIEEEIIGILAKEVAPGEPEEMLKATAVILRTYVMRRKLGVVEEGEIQGLSIKGMKDLWQNDFDETYDRYERVVYATKGEVIYYADELIEPIYHQESAGYTRGAKSLFGVDVPYLQPVESLGDGEVTTITISKEEVVTKLKSVYKDLAIEAEGLEQKVQIIGRDSSGYITKIQVGNHVLGGEIFRKILGLKSAHMQIASEKENLVFEVKGSGHGGGLSQKGASLLATEGKNYKEILNYYFKGVEILPLKE